MTDQEKQLFEILNVFDKEGFLKHTILIGSWCLVFYKQIFETFKPNIKTSDIDFYIPNAKAVKEKNNVIESFEEIHYTVVHDSMTNKTRFISPLGFELEFLTNLTRSNLPCVRLGDTNIYAESLSYVDIFAGNYIEVKYNNLNVKVASPASYVLQKLLINDLRREDKRAKDIESVKDVLVYVNASRKYRDELKNLYSSLPKKWQRKISEVASKNNVSLDF